MYTIEKKTLTDIADAIREKTGKSGLILPGEMPGEIKKIKGTSELDPGIIYKSPNFNTSIDIIEGQENQIMYFSTEGIIFYYKSTVNTRFGLITANKINISDYTLLYIKGLINSVVNVTDPYVVNFGIANGVRDYMPTYVKSSIISIASAEEQTIEIDILDYIGEYYIALSGFGFNAKIHEIGLR